MTEEKLQTEQSLQPGDIFFVHGNKTLIQRCINLVQWVHDRLDADPSQSSNTAHTGIVKNEQGKTFESRLRIGTYDFHRYAGQELSIYRHIDMTHKKALSGLLGVLHHEGQIYPIHRLPLHVIPGLAKNFAPLPKPVCSELAAKFLWYAGLWKDNYWGVNVDMLFDCIDGSPKYRLVFCGKWPGNQR